MYKKYWFQFVENTKYISVQYYGIIFHNRLNICTRNHHCEIKSGAISKSAILFHHWKKEFPKLWTFGQNKKKHLILSISFHVMIL